MEDEEDTPAFPESPIHRAAHFGDIVELRRLLATGVDVNTQTEYDAMTPLMAAARSAEGATVETLAFLLEAGGDLHAVSAVGSTAARYAAENIWWHESPMPIRPDQVERLRFLLDAGLDPHETALYGRSLLSLSCRVGDPAKVRLLLDRGVPPNPVPFPGQEKQAEEIKAGRHSSGLPEDPAFLIEGGLYPSEYWAYQIPLLQAAEAGSAECVQLLLAAGVDPNFTAGDTDAPTALSRTVSPEVARVLLAAGARPDVRLPDGRDTLDIVLANTEGGWDQPDSDRFATAQVLLDAGAPLEFASRHGWTRLYLAAFWWKAEAVDFLLARGASLAPSYKDGTPLHAICWQGGYEDEIFEEFYVSCERIVRALVAAGNPIDARDNMGRTPLHEAVAGDGTSITAVKTLLELGAEPDPVDIYGQSPLHLVVVWGIRPLACVKWLLTHGADPLRQDGNQQTPLELARQRELSWQEVAAKNESVPFFKEDPEKRAERHAEILRQAAEVYALLKEASGE